MLGHAPTLFQSAARSTLTYELGKERRNGNLRLNATLPECPDYDDAPPKGPAQQKPEANFATSDEHSGLGRSGANKAPDKEKKPATRDRVLHITRRIRGRLESTSNPSFALYAWACVSAATVPWKLKIFDEIHPTGNWSLSGYDLTRDDFVGLCCLVSRRHGNTHPVVKRVADGFAAAGLLIPSEYAFRPSAADIMAVTDCGSYSVYSKDPLWLCTPEPYDEYVRWLTSVMNYRP